MWLMWLLTTILITVILLNLLIAIMSDTYDKITESGENALYFETIQMIVENRFLNSRKSLFGNSRYLLLITDTDYAKSGSGDWQGRVMAIKNTVESITDETRRLVGQVQKRLDDNMRIMDSRFKNVNRLMDEKIQEVIGVIQQQNT